MGRNPFGSTPKLEDLRASEYVRLLGPDLAAPCTEVRRAWDERLRYRVKVAPNPDSSELLFYPEGEMPYGVLRDVITHEREKRERFFAQLKVSRKHRPLADTAEQPDIIAEIPNYLPRTHSATVFLTNLEGSQKKKLIILGIFPAVNLAYWQLLNTEFLESHLEPTVTGFCRAAISGHEKSSGTEHAPSVYAYWTALFSAAIQSQFISILPAWNLFPRYCKAFNSHDLVGSDRAAPRKARSYLELLGRLRRLQHIVGCSRAGILDANGIRDQLADVEGANRIDYGVLDPMNTNQPGTAADYLGEAYGLLRDKQRQKVDEFVRQSWQGTPEHKR